MPKPHSKLLAFNKIYYEIYKKFGFKIANDWLRMEWIGNLYMHDAPSATFRSYCFAYDLKDLAEKNGFAREVKEYKANPDSFKGHVGDVSNVIRVAVTGRTKSPDLYSIMKTLGKDRVLERISAYKGAIS